MKQAIAIVGFACRYPEASSPNELWENVLGQRRAFRAIPAQRLRREDYFRPDSEDADGLYSFRAAVLEGYTFDRIRFKIGADTFRVTDMAHWLALEVAADALEDAGFPEGKGLPNTETGVLLGNTLTGEFSRSNLLRLRWPYVRRTVAATLAARGFDGEQRRELLADLEATFKAPFPETTADSLAGGLANTIAGRICNHFDLHGGGYTVDGACSSSLLAVAQSCSALLAGDLDVALAGGVDLSLDPFELVGFARTGALSRDQMWVYDRRSQGFIPGEGCGIVVLMRLEDAIAQGRRIYSTVRGWGISSDGSGGMTRPEVHGQTLALQRAYRRAGFGIESVALFEGHGTGTAVGDATELETLATARRQAESNGADGRGLGAVVGSIKANIGHTKAAAGAAGLIKASLALDHRVLPPTTGSEEPHPVLHDGSPLRTLDRPETWPETSARRASVSAMGFGGINCHLALEGAPETGSRSTVSFDPRFTSGPQDTEVLFFSGHDPEGLAATIRPVAERGESLSQAQVADLAGHLAATLDPEAPWRAAAVVGCPEDLAPALETLQTWLREADAAEPRPRLDRDAGCFLGGPSSPPRIGLLFPGQGSPVYLREARWKRRFLSFQRWLERAALPADGEPTDTRVAQPSIVAGSLGALELLERLGLRGDLAIGHSLGELVALAWSGAYGKEAALELAAARGRAMSDLGDPSGAMAALACDPDSANGLLRSAACHDSWGLTGFNSSRQTVAAGPAEGIERLLETARREGIEATRIPVSHAFHSPGVAAAVPVLAAALDRRELDPPKRPVYSTVTGERLGPSSSCHDLLLRQVTSPVLFTSAVANAAAEVDLFLEVGPGGVLSSLVNGEEGLPRALPLDAGGRSLRPLLATLASLFVLRADWSPEALFTDRALRPFDLEHPPEFLVNPCELAPDDEGTVHFRAAEPADAAAEPDLDASAIDLDPLEVIRAVIGRRTELPPEAIDPGSRLLSDLHLNSIGVGELVIEAARQLGLGPPASPTEYADASVHEVAAALAELRAAGGAESEEDALPPGLGAWVRSFAVEPVRFEPHPPRISADADGRHEVLAAEGEPLGEVFGELAAEAPTETPGVLLVSPEPEAETELELLLTAGRAALQRRCPLVVVQRAPGAAALARAWFLESDLPVAVFQLPPEAETDARAWAARVLDHCARLAGFQELVFDASGACFRPTLRLLEDAPRRSAGLPPVSTPALQPGDLLLVTGGGKGIGAECALALARRFRVRLALLGRSRPEDDEELRGNLDRFRAQGVDCRYLSTDLTSPEAIDHALAALAEEGPVRGVLHSAGRNHPRLFAALTEEDFAATLAPKVAGLRTLLGRLETSELRLVVGFGSIIARAGLRGESDYAFANERLRLDLEAFDREHPLCRCLCIEWSVWSGVGMGARLSNLEAMGRQGITPISPQDGIAALVDLLQSTTPVAVVVSGRFGQPPTLDFESRQLPLLRFLDRPRFHLPGVELVAEAELSTATDPYLEDHVLAGERLFPAVLGLESMAQAYRALSADDELPEFHEVRFQRPISVPEHEPVVLRLVALRAPDGTVDVALRSSATAFQLDHFRALCRPRSRAAGDGTPFSFSGRYSTSPAIELDPGTDLYGSVLFQNGRFRRLETYSHLQATSCVAEIRGDDREHWFGSFLPQDLLLGDPGRRDACLHGLQASIPHATVLPVAVDRLSVHRAGHDGVRLTAKERERRGKALIYDLEVRDHQDRVVETWEGLELRIVGEESQPQGLAPALLGPYLERRLGDLLPTRSLRVAMASFPDEDREQRRIRVAPLVLNGSSDLFHRPDGRPEAGNGCISFSHRGAWTLAVGQPGSKADLEPVSCDLEPVSPRPEKLWRELLGRGRWPLVELVGRETGESLDISATRVWTVQECLRKVGLAGETPVVLEKTTADGWVLFAAGSVKIAVVLAGALEGSPQWVIALIPSVTGSPTPTNLDQILERTVSSHG